MNPKTFFQVRQNTFFVDASLLFLRIVTGLALMSHGYGKILAPFAWMPEGSGVPGIFQALAAVSEFGGGLALILGLLTRLGSLGIVFTMAGAVLTHVSMGDGFLAAEGKHGYELALVYLAVAATFLAGGPGGLSIDRFVFGRK